MDFFNFYSLFLIAVWKEECGIFCRVVVVYSSLVVVYFILKRRRTSIVFKSFFSVVFLHTY